KPPLDFPPDPEAEPVDEALLKAEGEHRKDADPQRQSSEAHNQRSDPGEPTEVDEKPAEERASENRSVRGVACRGQEGNQPNEGKRKKVPGSEGEHDAGGAHQQVEEG